MYNQWPFVENGDLMVIEWQNNKGMWQGMARQQIGRLISHVSKRHRGISLDQESRTNEFRGE